MPFATTALKGSRRAAVQQSTGHRDSSGGYLTGTGKARKAVIKAALAGKGREQVTGWHARWMAFPQGRYTTRCLTARARPAALCATDAGRRTCS